MCRWSGLCVLLWFVAAPVWAQRPSGVAEAIEATRAQWSAVARQIWGFAEVGYQEERSSALHQAQLHKAGFTVQAGVAGMPTAFVATYGSGRPVIAILAEFDALPGLSQDSVPVRKVLVDMGPGHGCGHHLFGTASVAAGVAVKDWLAAGSRQGTIRVYGTPAEEGGAGKVYMVRAGLFGDVDVVLNWHPGDRNDASQETSLANKSAKFRFHGLSAHAAGAPERGRSALDGVEAMNHMVNLMREHVPSDARIHYVITHGGQAPNVVPDFAEVYYYVRHPSAEMVMEMFDRIAKAGEGAAMGTGTTMDFEVIHGVYSLLPIDTLGRLMDANLRKVGGIRYTPAEQAFAERLYPMLTTPDLPLGSQAEVQPYEQKVAGGSTDVGDVSWVVPTVGLSTATWVPGTAAHSWHAVAAGGTGIGTQGMMVAAKTMALTAVDLFSNPRYVEAARREFDRKRGAGFAYQSLVGDRSPPLDYRR